MSIGERIHAFLAVSETFLRQSDDAASRDGLDHQPDFWKLESEHAGECEMQRRSVDTNHRSVVGLVRGA